MKYVFYLVVSTVSIFSSLLPVQASPIKPDSCEYYDYLNTKLNCGLDGYINKFARLYCNAYLYRKNDFSPHGQLVLRDIRTCLQESLLSQEENLSCANVENYGLSSHEYCYVKSGYCTLQSADVRKIFWIARGEIRHPHIWAMISKINKACAQLRQ